MLGLQVLLCGVSKGLVGTCDAGTGTGTGALGCRGQFMSSCIPTTVVVRSYRMSTVD